MRTTRRVSGTSVLDRPEDPCLRARAPAGSTILLVGDGTVDLGTLRSVLDGGGYRVLTAGSGVEGLEVARTQAPDLVVSAVLMAGMDGFEFVQALRCDPATAGTRVVFWTVAFTEEDIRTLASACGVTHLICEPCAPEQMLAAVKDGLTAEADTSWPPASEDLREHVRMLNGRLIRKSDELDHTERRTGQLLSLVAALEAVIPAGMALLDDHFRVIRANDTFAALHGTPRSAQVGRALTELVPALAADLEPGFRNVLATDATVVNLESEGAAPSAPDDRRCWLSSMYRVRVDGEARGVGLLVVDVTERRRTDALRAAVMDTMVEGVFVCDASGEIVFANAAAAELLGWTTDDLCGNAIDVIVPAAGAAGHPHCVPVSAVGGAIPGPREAESAFLRRDGTAMPVAFSVASLPMGEALTGCVTVFRDITIAKAEDLRVQRELDDLNWLGRIRDALTEDRFVLYSQPIVSLRGGAGGEELLLRMRLPSGEIVEPGRFLPVAERFGLITEIDRWVVAEAMRFAGPDRDVGINLSARSLGDPTLLEYIASQFERSGVSPANIVFEITETALMEHFEAARLLVEGLTELGAGVALDDFGTGFGTFTYLKHLPLRFLKIDAEFVKDLTSHPANRHLVKATVGLARDFGYRTVAEGVENAATLTMLDELGVDLVQGFHLGRPAPVAP